MRIVPFRTAAPWFLALALAAPAAAAGVSVSFEADTLDRLLRAASTQDVDIPLNETRSVRVELRDIRLVELQPAAEGSHGRGFLSTSVDVAIPELDVRWSLRPTVVLDVVRVGEQSLFEMRFVKLRIPVPILGEFDIAPFLQPLRYPAEDLWYLPGARGTVHLKSRLVDITMGQRAVRFDFELDITEP